MLLEPKEVEIEGPDGKKRRFIISKFPAMAGREIVAKYPVSLVPKLGDYTTSEGIVLKMMCFVGVPRDGLEPLPLTTRALVDNHTGSWETLAKLEWGLMEYNVSFFGNGKSSDFFASIAQTLKAWITSTLTDLSAASSPPIKRHSTNSKRSTPSKRRS